MECVFAIDDRQVTAMSHGKRFRQKVHHAVFIARVSRFIPGNQLTLLQNGAAYFPAIEAAFDRAGHEIYLETYIYENDANGRRIADALKWAVLHGVNVYMLIDGYDSMDLPQSMLDYLRAGGDFEPFKTSSLFDGTARNPEWLGEEPQRLQQLKPKEG